MASGAEPGAPEAAATTVVVDERLSCLYWASTALLSNEEYAAGLPEDEYLRRTAQVTKLEFFMSSLENAEHLADFPCLVELAIHLEKVPRAVGLANKPQLQRLAMTECGLKRMRGIEACVSLTHLDLSHNKLTEIDAAVLRPLTKLRTLWLNDNGIDVIAGLEPLAQLTTLWLCANRISAICDALSGNPALEELNLAGNHIANFKDIPHLSRLRKLTNLCLAEPHFGDNPLCSLCNYQTYVLFHIAHLKRFDAILITDDLRQLAEAVRLPAAPGAPAAARGLLRACAPWCVGLSLLPSPSPSPSCPCQARTPRAPLPPPPAHRPPPARPPARPCRRRT